MRMEEVGKEPCDGDPIPDQCRNSWGALWIPEGCGHPQGCHLSSQTSLHMQMSLAA